MARKGFFKADEACREWWGKVAQVSDLFERRWTRAALKRVDPVLSARLDAQIAQFDRACLAGTVADIEEQGGGTVRGWMRAVATMEEAGIEDDAYMLGSDPVSGLKIAIGNQKAAINRVSEIHGQDVIWVTPDEVATMLAGVEAFKSIGAIKQKFPGSEITRYEGEGT